MYFLNGDRIYVNPEESCVSADEQLKNCLQQLTNAKPGLKLFKLNLFVETNSKEEYNAFRKKAEKEVQQFFAEAVLVSVIAQPPLTCKVIAEACLYNPVEWEVKFFGNHANGGALFKKENTSILIGTVQANSNNSCKISAEIAFSHLIDIFTDALFPINSIVRQWNYIENILGYDNEKQRYQEFNDVRSGVYGNTFSKKGYPAATGIGMSQGGIIIEFLAIKSHELVSWPIDNPLQISAHGYTEDVLAGEKCPDKTTPKFERARYLQMFNKKLILISGTAAILGEKTAEVGDSARQAEIAIENIKQLYSEKVVSSFTNRTLIPKYGHARVYIKNRKDFGIIKKTFERYYDDLPVVYIIADICRDDLLVEIEGRVILE